MSLFRRKGAKGGREEVQAQQQQQQPPAPEPRVNRPQLQFHCQQAQGSPLGIVSGFSSVRELYAKIAACYDFPPEDILFCTLNTHKVDMTKLLGAQIGLEDFIFAHRKGRPKEVEIVKSEESLGLTITDNGAGYAFIKRIKEGSVVDRLPHVSVGDHIERLDDRDVVGKRHYDVAKTLKEIPEGAVFTMRLVEPLKSGFSGVGPKAAPGARKRGVGTGRETLRFKADGRAAVEDLHDDETAVGIDKINGLLESFMGINDADLAHQMWELSRNCTNSMQLAEAVDASDLAEFGFTDDFVIELWGVVTDARSGRL